MSAQEAPKPGEEQADGSSAAPDGPSPTVAPKPKSPSPPPVTVKKEPGTSETSNGKVGDANPAEICVVLGGADGGASGAGSRRAQAEGIFSIGTPPPTKSTDSCIGVFRHTLIYLKTSLSFLKNQQERFFFSLTLTFSN